MNRFLLDVFILIFLDRLLFSSLNLELPVFFIAGVFLIISLLFLLPQSLLLVN